MQDSAPDGSSELARAFFAVSTLGLLLPVLAGHVEFYLRGFAGSGTVLQMLLPRHLHGRLGGLHLSLGVCLDRAAKICCVSDVLYLKFVLL